MYLADDGGPDKNRKSVRTIKTKTHQLLKGKLSKISGYIIYQHNQYNPDSCSDGSNGDNLQCIRCIMNMHISIQVTISNAKVLETKMELRKKKLLFSNNSVLLVD